MPPVAWGWEITPDEFQSWIVADSVDLAVINKPPYVLCHPSKHGPWSSLVSAAREYFEVPVIHMPFRLDRETSGVWLAAKTREKGVELQKAVQERRVRKEYLVILEGELFDAQVVDQPIGRAEGSVIWLKRGVRSGGQRATTRFEPVEIREGHTLVRVVPETGRLHQIRVHAAWMGHPVVGDKIYGSDETVFLDFIENGLEGRTRAELSLPRQALHCSEVRFLGENGGNQTYAAPFAADLAEYWTALSLHRINKKNNAPL